MAKTLTLLFFIVVSTVTAQWSYAVPELTIEVLKSGIGRVYIPDFEGTHLFAFHGNVNEAITKTEPGTIFAEANTKTDDFWVLTFNSPLQVGDVVHYWAFVNFNRVGYRKEGSLEIKELRDSFAPLTISSCITASTLINRGKSTCVGQSIIEDEFDGPSVDKNNWIVEHRIPTYAGPNFEFNSYKDRRDVRFFKNGVLFLKPRAIENEQEVRGTINLTDKCTSNDPNQCIYKQVSSFLLPPTISGRIVSKVSFKYGKVEIRAKLPAGDWIFPMVELEPKDKLEGENSPMIWVAYSRGNDHLVGDGPDDYGSRLLFGGPVLHPAEPLRSAALATRLAKEPYNSAFHVYTLEWKPGRMLLYIDSVLYGDIPTADGFPNPDMDVRHLSSPEAPFNREYVLALGVGVGGLNDFPDGFGPINGTKPWSNTERNYIKHFFDARDVWMKTWNGDKPALQIDYVKVTAI